jgi:hypothetical protein
MALDRTWYIAAGLGVVGVGIWTYVGVTLAGDQTPPAATDGPRAAAAIGPAVEEVTPRVHEPPPTPARDGPQEARDAFATTLAAMLERDGWSMSVVARGTSLIVVTNGCNDRIIELLEQSSREQLTNLGFERVMCPAGPATAVGP